MDFELEGVRYWIAGAEPLSQPDIRKDLRGEHTRGAVVSPLGAVSSLARPCFQAAMRAAPKYLLRRLAFMPLSWPQWQVKGMFCCSRASQILVNFAR